MKYKRLLCVLLSICMFLCLTACQKDDTDRPQTAQSKVASKNSQKEDAPDRPQETQSEVASKGSQKEDNPNTVGILVLEEIFHTAYGWTEGYDKAMARSESSFVKIEKENAVFFPKMAETLNQIYDTDLNSRGEGYEKLYAAARENLYENWDSFTPYVSTQKVLVRRADTVAVSLLIDYYSDYGQIKDRRDLHGRNFDTQTGKELALNDVIKAVNGDLAAAVKKELTDHKWKGKLYSDSIVEKYFSKTPHDSINWTLDYNGVTFYFAPGELSDEGAPTATVSFAKYPKLFHKKYMDVPAEYIVEMPLNTSFFTDLDADGALEEISISGRYDRQSYHYTDYSIRTDTEAKHYEEECYVHTFHPYYVKTKNGNFVYLFCEDYKEGERQMRLIILRLNKNGSVSKSGEKEISPSWDSDIMLSLPNFTVPTDPNRLILDDIDNDIKKGLFTVGKDGVPIKQ